MFLLQPLFTFFSTTMIPFLATFIGAAAIQVLLSIGVGVATYSGLSVLLDAAMQQMLTEFNGLPADAIQILGLMGVDTALNIMFSAAVTLLTIKGMSKAGSLTRAGFIGK